MFRQTKTANVETYSFVSFGSTRSSADVALNEAADLLEPTSKSTKSSNTQESVKLNVSYLKTDAECEFECLPGDINICSAPIVLLEQWLVCDERSEQYRSNDTFGCPQSSI